MTTNRDKAYDILVEAVNKMENLDFSFGDTVELEDDFKRLINDKFRKQQSLKSLGGISEVIKNSTIEERFDSSFFLQDGKIHKKGEDGNCEECYSLDIIEFTKKEAISIVLDSLSKL